MDCGGIDLPHAQPSAVEGLIHPTQSHQLWGRCQISLPLMLDALRVTLLIYDGCGKTVRGGKEGCGALRVLDLPVRASPVSGFS